MKSVIENRYRMTKARYLDWALHPIPGKNKKRISSNFIWAGFSVLTAYLAVKGFVDADYVVAACFMLLTLISVFSVFFMTRIAGWREYKKMAKYQGTDEWERAIRFSDSITFTDGRLKSELTYDMFTELVKTRDYLALRLSRGSYLRLYKKGFKKCSESEFIDFIKQKNPNIRLRSV